MKTISKKNRYSAIFLTIVVLLSSCKDNDVNKQSFYLQLDGPVELTVPE